MLFLSISDKTLSLIATLKRLFEKLFIEILLISRVFVLKADESKQPKKYFFSNFYLLEDYLNLGQKIKKKNISFQPAAF